MDRRRFLRRTAAVAPTALAGCLAQSHPDYDVGMSATAFLPDEFTVEVGDSVDWRNTGSRAHTVTAYEGTLPEDAAYFASGAFPSQAAAVDAWYDHMGGALYSGEHFAHRFEVAGEHPYYCIPHEGGGMIGTVIVE